MTALVTDVKVLNTVAAEGTDVTVDSNGVVNFANALNVRARNIISINKQASVAETKQVWTITPTAVANTTYYFVINGYHKSNGSLFVLPLTIISGATTSATLICDAFRALLNQQPDINVVASGTSTLILTASGAGTTGNGILATFVVDTSLDANLAEVNTTPGVPEQGTYYDLNRKYPVRSTVVSAGYPDIENLQTASTYTEYDIVYRVEAEGGGNSIKQPIYHQTLALLVKEGVTNFDDLAGTYGTLTGLKSGYATTIVPVTTVGNKAAAITITTGVITLSGSDSPTFASEDIRVNDVINIGGTAGTYSRNQSILTQTTAVGTTTAAVGASAYRVVKYRAIPF